MLESRWQAEEIDSGWQVDGSPARGRVRSLRRLALGVHSLLDSPRRQIVTQRFIEIAK